MHSPCTCTDFNAQTQEAAIRFSLQKPGCKKRAKLVCHWQAVTLFYVRCDQLYRYSLFLQGAVRICTQAACEGCHMRQPVLDWSHPSKLHPITGGRGTRLFLPVIRGQTKYCRKTEHMQSGQRWGHWQHAPSEPVFGAGLASLMSRRRMPVGTRS